MNAKEIFSAAIRVLGLLAIGRGLNDLLYVLFYTLSLRVGDISVTAKAPDADLLFGIFYFFLGLYLLRGASFVVNFAFPYRETESKEAEQETTEADKISN